MKDSKFDCNGIISVNQNKFKFNPEIYKYGVTKFEILRNYDGPLLNNNRITKELISRNLLSRIFVENRDILTLNNQIDKDSAIFLAKMYDDILKFIWFDRIAVRWNIKHYSDYLWMMFVWICSLYG